MQRPTHHASDSDTPFDVALVFGEGPNLPVLLPSEASQTQTAAWEAFHQDPLRTEQPDFYLLNGNQYLSELTAIEEDSVLSAVEKKNAIQKKRSAWQKNSRFSLRRIGKLNALAAGGALYRGEVKKLILTGGRTLPAWKREEFKKQYLQEFPYKEQLAADALEEEVERYINYSVQWPSEAALMRDYIIKELGWNFFSRAYSQETLHRLFAERYAVPVTDSQQERYKQFTQEVYRQFLTEELMPKLLVEEASKNTLDNIVFSLNTFPDELRAKNKKIGFFASDWQRSRALLLAERFLLHVTEDAGISSQQYLRKRALKRKDIPDVHTMNMLMDDTNPSVSDSIKAQDVLVTGLKDEKYANYWAGWLFKIEDPKVFVQVVRQFKNEKWREAMQQEFLKVGLNFSELKEEELLKLAEEDPVTYQRIMDKGVALTTPEHRNNLPSYEEMMQLHSSVPQA